MGTCPFTQRAEVHSTTCVDLHGVFSRRFNVLKYHRGITPDPSSCCPRRPCGLAWVVRNAARHPLCLPRDTPGGQAAREVFLDPGSEIHPQARVGGEEEGGICCGPTVVCRLLPAVLSQGSRETGHARPSRLGACTTSVCLPTVPFRPRAQTHTQTQSHIHFGELLRPFQVYSCFVSFVLASLAADDLKCSVLFPLLLLDMALLVDLPPCCLLPPYTSFISDLYYVCIFCIDSCLLRSHRAITDSNSIRISYRVRIGRKIPALPRPIHPIFAYETPWTLKWKLPT